MDGGWIFPIYLPWIGQAEHPNPPVLLNNFRTEKCNGDPLYFTTWKRPPKSKLVLLADQITSAYPGLFNSSKYLPFLSLYIWKGMKQCGAILSSFFSEPSIRRFCVACYATYENRPTGSLLFPCLMVSHALGACTAWGIPCLWFVSKFLFLHFFFFVSSFWLLASLSKQTQQRNLQRNLPHKSTLMLSVNS